MKKQLIILDRDGVIVYDNDNYIRTVSECIPIKGSIEAIAKLRKAGFLVAIATNQSGIGRGYYTKVTFLNMMNKINKLLQKTGENINALAFCPHIPKQNCSCRKPKDGLYKNISNDLNISLENAIVVGDSLRDIKPALENKALAYLVKTGKMDYKNNIYNVDVFDDLAKCSEHIIKKFI